MTTEQLKKKVAELLPDCEELRIYADARERQREDESLPHYHFNSPDGYLNDPCGYCYYKGLWHLFYQFIPVHVGLLGWGHAVSADKMHWIDLPCAVLPTMENCCGSGGAWTEEDCAYFVYQGSMKGKSSDAIHIMKSTDDLLIHWDRVTEQPIITTYNDDGTRNPYNAFDPCIWKEDDIYYILSAGGGSLPHPPVMEELDHRRFYLYSSTDTENWTYLHSFVENDIYATFGDDGACPYFLPIGDKHILLHFSHMSGGKYIIGTYDREKHKFYAEKGGSFNSNAWQGGVHAPSAHSDGRDGINNIFNINFADPSTRQCMSLPLNLQLDESGELHIRPDGDYESLRHEHHAGQCRLSGNTDVVLYGVEGKSLELKLRFNSAEERPTENLCRPHNLLPLIEVKVLRSPDEREYTSIRFYRNRSTLDWTVFNSFEGMAGWSNSPRSVVEVDSAHSTLSPDVAIHPNESKQLYLRPDEDMELHIFVDHNVVEVFANDRLYFAVRVYPTLAESVGVSVQSHGADAVVSYEAWNIRSCD